MGVDVCTYRVRAHRQVFCLPFRYSASGHSRFATEMNLISVHSPRLSTLLLSACLAFLLLCAGDTESNSVPKIEGILTLLKNCHEATTTDLNEIKKQISRIEACLTDIEKLWLIPLS